MISRPAIIRVVTLAVGLITIAGCSGGGGGGGSAGGGGNGDGASTPTTYVGSFVGATRATTGTLVLQFASAPPPVSLTVVARKAFVSPTARIEAAAAPIAVTGTLTVGSIVSAVSGTYDPTSTALSAEGAGYAFAGKLTAKGIQGTLTAPNGTGGSFSAVGTTASTPATTYCGSYTVTGKSDAGQWNLTIAGGSVVGALDTGDFIYGKLTGTTIEITTGNGGTGSGRLDGSTVNGTWTGDGDSGTWQGTAEACLVAPPITHRIAGTVSGAVQDAVAVTLTSSAVVISTTTDTAGRFAFTAIPDGVYDLTATRPGYTFVPAVVSVTVRGADVTGANFVAGAAPSTFSIAGTVTIAGTPAPNVTVRLTDEHGTVLVKSATTDQSGWYAFEGLARGESYTVTLDPLAHTSVPSSKTYSDLARDETADFVATAIPAGEPFVNGIIATSPDAALLTALPSPIHLDYVFVQANAYTGVRLTPLDTSVTVNGTALTYDAPRRAFVGNVYLSPGEIVTVAVVVRGTTYVSDPEHLPPTPLISSPAAGATWDASVDNSVSWTGISTGFLVGVIDATGKVVYPKSTVITDIWSLRSVPATSTSSPAGTLPWGSDRVVVAAVWSTHITGEATNDTIFLASFAPATPVTVR